jgi:preprotein translocase subunit SecD
MLGIGIVLSLFTAMWISRILLLASTKYFVKQETLFLGKIQK